MEETLGNVSEVYSAIQGEGPLVGVSQLFVRLGGCDLRCVWCDTPDSLVKTKSCFFELEPGKRKYQEEDNPISHLKVLESLSSLSPDNHHSVSITGGEPLLQNKFLSLLLPMIKNKTSLPIYLETGGHRVEELKKIVYYLDFISMDFKLPSSAKTGDYWDKHKAFMQELIKAKKKFWVKIVVTSNTEINEVVHSLELIKSVCGLDGKVKVYLQPVTPISGVLPPSEVELLSMFAKLRYIYPNIRVLPQVHALIGQK